jgi:hypothetical protein
MPQRYWLQRCWYAIFAKMDDADIRKLFEPLFADLRGNDSFPAKRPLLAHYTSVEVLEAILRNNEVWFSNPLFMNDIEEVRFGMIAGENLFLSSPEIESACGSKERSVKLRATFNYWYNQFVNDHLLDLYVLCMSEHAREDIDGRLSMWRGYGGNGKGAAIVFDTAKIVALEDSPLIIANVHYGTRQARTNWLQERVAQFANILASSNIPDDKLFLCSFYFFQRLKLFSIFTKHQGFEEEREWRVVYMKDRDTKNVFENMFSYWVGPRGVEPKLKLKIQDFPGSLETDVSLLKIVEGIILGPSLSSPLARGTLLRMLDQLGRPELMDRLMSSSIPFRAG